MVSLTPPGCTCDGKSPRCDACVDQAMFWNAGTAAVRGRRWANETAAKVGTAKPWPPFEGKARDIALRWVRDIDGDPRVSEAFARRCHAAAAERWEDLRRSGER
jgi:hypothetical protein